jgi:hypothetical protein
MHAAAAAAAAAAACMRACVAVRVIDTMYQLIYSSAQTQAWRIEFSYRNIQEYFPRPKGRVRDTVSRARPFDSRNFREYFYTKIRFSTPALSALLGLAGKICLS